MGIMDGLKRQLRSVIEWRDTDPDQIFYRWTDNGDEIKNASKLIVGPGQGCIFVYEGEPKAMIVKSGIVSLETANIPFWTTIKKFMQLFESEHKVGIYFFRTTKILNQKWGTSSVIKYEDPKFHFPVGLRAFGNYSFRIRKPGHFFVNVVGGNNEFRVSQFRDVMNARLLQPLTDYLAESKYTYTEIDSHRDEISADLLEKLSSEFIKLGFTLTDLRIEGTSFDEDTMDRINRIADVTAEHHAATAAGMDYASLQKVEAMREAARNEGGGAGVGMGIGAGMGFGQMMADSMGGKLVPETGNGVNEHDPVAKLEKLKTMLEAELISQADYDEKKKEIMSQF
jgi:membrane protease subunit (stomatin/prohibitin family)